MKRYEHKKKKEYRTEHFTVTDSNLLVSAQFANA